MFRFVVAMVVVSCLIMGVASAAVPHLINYQGKLTDATGKPTNAAVSITFSFHDAEVGGSVLFSETQAVTVTKGIFNALIGSATEGGVPEMVFMMGNVYIGLQVNGEAVFPRQRITSVAYAYRADNAGYAQSAYSAETATTATTAATASNAANATTAQNANAIGGINLAGLDARFVNTTGDSMAGDLTLGGVLTAAYVRDANNPAYVLDPAGTSTIGELRTDIMYDRNNTTYFIDPASTSHVNYINANAFYDLGNSLFYLDPAGISEMNEVRASTFKDHDNTSFYVDPHSISYLNDLRVNILYDRNNTNYYLDPASTSSMNEVLASILRDRDNTSYYVNPATLSVLHDVMVDGTLTAPGLPIAYGSVQSNGTVISSTPNIYGCAWVAGVNRYEIILEDMSYDSGTYVTTVTPVNSLPRFATTTSGGGALLIYICDIAGSRIQSNFHFVVHKP